MARKISNLTQVNAVSGDMMVPVIDLTRSAGDRNIKVPATAFGGGGGGGSVERTVFSTSGELEANSIASILVYTGTAGMDLMLTTLQIRQMRLNTTDYKYQVWSGDPDDGGTLVFDSVDQTGAYIAAANYRSSAPIYIPYAAGSSEIWVRILSGVASSGLGYSIQTVCEEFAGEGEYLTGYSPPPQYDGPLLATVYVQEGVYDLENAIWPEPRYAMQAIADGGTMWIGGGTYYLPFGVANVEDVSLATHTNFGPNPSAVGGAARFVTGITIIGSGTLSLTPTIFDGQGGYGPGPSHPYRLTLGKGFLYARAPVNLWAVKLINGGGADGVADGEAAIYAEHFHQEGTLNCYYCMFDGNENGLYSPNAVSGGVPNPAGQYVNIALYNCDFGYQVSNGQSLDGLSHDFYLNCASVLVVDCVFHGCLHGNDMKSRSPYLEVTGGHVVNVDGRWIDYPNGGELICNGVTFYNGPYCNYNCLGYANENSENDLMNPVFTECVFWHGRYNSHFWMNVPAIYFDLVDCTQYYFQLPSGPAPTLTPTRDNVTQDPTAAPNMVLTIPDPLDAAPTYPGPVSGGFP